MGLRLTSWADWTPWPKINPGNMQLLFSGRRGLGKEKKAEKKSSKIVATSDYRDIEGHKLFHELADKKREKQAKKLKTRERKAGVKERREIREEKKFEKAQTKWSNAREKENEARKRKITEDKKAKAWQKTLEIRAKMKVQKSLGRRVIVNHRPGYWLTHNRFGAD